MNSGRWIDNNNDAKLHGTGTGLHNVRERLENAFPGKHKLNIVKNEDSVLIKMEIENKKKDLFMI